MHSKFLPEGKVPNNNQLLFITYTIIQSKTCSEILASERTGCRHGHAISGVGFSMGDQPGPLLDTTGRQESNLQLLLLVCSNYAVQLLVILYVFIFVIK